MHTWTGITKAAVECSEVLRLGARQVMGTPHFTSVAPRYDELWGFTYEPIAEFIVQYLQLEPDDHLADVGGGTGAVSHLVWKKAGEYAVFSEIKMS